MSKLISVLCAAGLMASTAAAPAAASPLVPAPAFQTDNSVIQVGHKGKRKWRGHRGGDVDWWWIPGAFIAGAAVGSALSTPRYRTYRYVQHSGDAHVRWCYQRYQSYRDWDNTFQPFHGPRRQCISPYGP